MRFSFKTGWLSFYKMTVIVVTMGNKIRIKRKIFYNKLKCVYNFPAILLYPKFVLNDWIYSEKYIKFLYVTKIIILKKIYLSIKFHYQNRSIHGWKWAENWTLNGKRPIHLINIDVCTIENGDKSFTKHWIAKTSHISRVVLILSWHNVWRTKQFPTLFRN